MGKKLKIAFLHKALLFGGAERLILDMSLGFISQGHSVTIYTAEYNEEKTFPEFKEYKEKNLNIKVDRIQEENRWVHPGSNQGKVPCLAEHR